MADFKCLNTNDNVHDILPKFCNAFNNYKRSDEHNRFLLLEQ